MNNKLYVLLLEMKAFILMILTLNTTGILSFIVFIYALLCLFGVVIVSLRR